MDKHLQERKNKRRAIVKFMGNTILKSRPIQTKKSPPKKQTYISIEFRSMMPSEYTAYERSKLREFEKTVMGSWSVKAKSDK